jgi:hypothetical protein
VICGEWLAAGGVAKAMQPEEAVGNGIAGGGRKELGAGCVWLVPFESRRLQCAGHSGGRLCHSLKAGLA